MLISIVFAIFVVSFIALNTTWLDIYIDKTSTFIYFKYSYLASMLILSSFLIAHARYHIKLSGQSNKRFFQLTVGILFGITVIGKLLMTYYYLAYTQQLLSEMSFSKEIKAENTIFDADRMYEIHGVLIEYYDFNRTKKIYEPSPIVKEIKKLRDTSIDEMHLIPVSLVLVFLVLIFSSWLGNQIAYRSLKRKSNNENDITTQRRPIKNPRAAF